VPESAPGTGGASGADRLVDPSADALDCAVLTQIHTSSAAMTIAKTPNQPRPERVHSPPPRFIVASVPLASFHGKGIASRKPVFPE
jgi:hypothetical protein